jgi:hypothetical protein
MIPVSNFMKIRPVGDELFYTDGRTDMTTLIVAFRNSANSPKKCNNDGNSKLVNYSSFGKGRDMSKQGMNNC